MIHLKGRLAHSLISTTRQMMQKLGLNTGEWSNICAQLYWFVCTDVEQVTLSAYCTYLSSVCVVVYPGVQPAVEQLFLGMHLLQESLGMNNLFCWQQPPIPARPCRANGAQAGWNARAERSKCKAVRFQVLFLQSSVWQRGSNHTVCLQLKWIQ